MGYDSKGLNLVSMGIAQARQWDYEDTGGEALSAYATAGFFADAKDKGMKVGDYVNIRDKANGIQYEGRISAVQDTGGTTGTFVADTG